MNPRTLIKNIPSRKQRWKMPVPEWIRMLHEERFDSPRSKSFFNEPDYVDDGEIHEPPFDEDTGPVGEPPPEQPSLADLHRPDEYADGCAPFSFLSPNVGEEHDPKFDEVPPQHSIEYETRERDARMYTRQREFRLAAEYITREFAQLADVEKVVLFGSVAAKLKKELPRFQRLRYNGIRIAHECKDVDLAVYMSSLTSLKELQRARACALARLRADRNIAVPHFKVDVHVMEPGTNRYRGRLCDFGQCPKGGEEACRVSGCGVQPFLRQLPDYQLDIIRFFDWKREVLFDRKTGLAKGLECDDVPF